MAVSTSNARDVSTLVIACNKDGMESLQANNYRAAFEQLKYAEAMLIANQSPDHDEILAVTCNNLGCYYKRTGKLHAALCYLRRALSLEADVGADKITIAGTHLNVCAILSRLGKHEKALQHAFCSQDLVSDAVVEGGGRNCPPDYHATLVIAYHNIAVEREFLDQWDLAAMAHKEGQEIAERCLGPNHPLAQTMAKNCQAVLTKSAAAKQKERSRFKQWDGGEGSPDEPGFESPTSLDVDTDLGSLARPGTGDGRLGGGRPDSRDFDSRAASTETQHWTRDSNNGRPTTAPDRRKSETPGDGTDLWTGSGDAPSGRRTAEPGGSSSLAPTAPGTRRPQSSHARAQRYAHKVVSPDAEQENVPVEGDEAVDTFMPSRPKAIERLDDGKLQNLSLRDASNARMLEEVEEQRESRRRARRALQQGGMDDVREKSSMHEELLSAEHQSNQVRSLRSAGSDYRPNRILQGSSRTAIVLRKYGRMNESKHRDNVIKDRMDLAKRSRQGAIGVSGKQKQSAATKIQHMWKRWCQYCRVHKNYMELRQSAARAIQRNYKHFHKKRYKLDRAATSMQRFARGYLVRHVLRLNMAAVTIQRHIAGYLCRKELGRLNTSAVAIQRLVRGGLGRMYYRLLGSHRTQAVVIMQAGWRSKVARDVCRREAAVRMMEERTLHLALIMQRYCRGFIARKNAKRIGAELREEMRLYGAATRIQSIVRRDLSQRRVSEVRTKKRMRMGVAATYMRKMWLGYKVRRRYVQMRQAFESNESAVVVLQRFGRGFLVRLRLWNATIQQEEDKWAAVEIQRAYRGYMGRLRWEMLYIEKWSRTMAAARIQRVVRRWLAYVRVWRKKQKHAEEKLAKHQRLTSAAICIQRHARGIMTRKRIYDAVGHLIHAIKFIQKIFRGYRVRNGIWKQVHHYNATKINSHVRGFLVRARCKHLEYQMVLVQRYYRWFARQSSARKEEARQLRRDRMKAAKSMQIGWREYQRVRDPARSSYMNALTKDAVEAELGRKIDAKEYSEHREEELKIFNETNVVLSGVMGRVERKWARAAARIQRSVRVRLLKIPIEKARKVPFTSHGFITFK